jgi:hypothetical protein
MANAKTRGTLILEELQIQLANASVVYTEKYSVIRSSICRLDSVIQDSVAKNHHWFRSVAS